MSHEAPATPRKRILCLHFPNWSVQRLVHEQPELRDQPIVLFGRLGRQARCVWAGNRMAEDQGIRIGMPLVEAKRHFTGCLQALDTDQDLQALEKLALECQRFTPYCGTKPADPHRWSHDTILLDITPTIKFFGSEPELLRQILEELTRLGYQMQGVVAENWAAAWGLAVYVSARELETNALISRHDSWIASLAGAQQQTAVDALPTAALRIEPVVGQKLAELGVETIAQVRRLPAASLPARFGPELNLRLLEIAGQIQEPIQASCQETTFHQWRSLEFPTVELEVLRHHVACLLDELLPDIVRRQAGVMSLVCQWFTATTSPIETSLRLVHPIQDSQYLLQLLQLQWERLSLSQEITAVHVLVPQIALDKPRQQWLFEDSEDTERRNRSTLLDRLSSRLGPSQVFQVRWQAQALPERSFVPRARIVRQSKAKLSPAQPSDSSSKLIDLRLLERPSRLYAQPVRLRPLTEERLTIPTTHYGVPRVFQVGGQQHTVQRVVGPERIESQWWEGRWVRRDYFRVHTESGQRFWVFQELGTNHWWLHGDFA
jgi:protein ImuB